MPRPRMYIRVHSWATSLQANSLLYGTTDVRVRSADPFTVSFFENSGVDTRREHKLTAGTPKNEHPCSFLGCQFAEANWLLLEITAVHGGSDTLRINLCVATQ